MEDVSVNENGEPLGITPDTPTPAEPVADMPAAQIPAPTPPIEPAPAVPPVAPMEPAPAIPTALEPPVEPWPAPAVPEPPSVEPEPVPAPSEPAPAPEATASESAPAPAEQLANEVPVAAAAAAVVVGTEAAAAEVVPEPDLSDGLTGQLRALTETLDEPTDETTPAEAQAAEEGVESAEPGEAAEPAEGTEGASDSLDDIAPGTVAAATSAEGEPDATLDEVQVPLTKVSWWPFVGYIVVWLAAAGYAVWQIEQLPIGQAAYETNFYATTMLVGLSLLAVGPALILIVWLASWIGRKGARIGLMFISALLKGALATLIGAMIWIGALLLIDYLRLGRPF